jgi:hypothetical protein
MSILYSFFVFDAMGDEIGFNCAKYSFLFILTPLVLFKCNSGRIKKMGNQVYEHGIEINEIEVINAIHIKE